MGTSRGGVGADKSGPVGCHSLVRWPQWHWLPLGKARDFPDLDGENWEGWKDSSLLVSWANSGEGASGASKPGG